MKITELIKQAQKVLDKYGDLNVHCIRYTGRYCQACARIRPVTKYGDVRRTYTDAHNPYWFIIEFDRDTTDGADTLPESE